MIDPPTLEKAWLPLILIFKMLVQNPKDFDIL